MSEQVPKAQAVSRMEEAKRLSYKLFEKNWSTSHRNGKALAKKCLEAALDMVAHCDAFQNHIFKKYYPEQEQREEAK
jgi:hypothetical protein